jgi:hypothetical protein
MQDMQAAHDSTIRNVLDKYAMLRQTAAEHNQGLTQSLVLSSERAMPSSNFMQMV